MKSPLSILLAALLVAAMTSSPPAAQEAEIPRLVDQLGADSPETRVAAEARLGELGGEAFAALFPATLSNDLEQARRARRLIARLDAAAFPDLTREARSEDAARARQARLLLAGLTDRLVQRKLAGLLQRIDNAVAEGRVTDVESRAWKSQLQRGRVVLTVNEWGQLNETGLERLLACREAIPPEWLTDQDAATAELPAFRDADDLPPEYAAAWDVLAARRGDGPQLRRLFADMVSAEPALIAAAAEVLAARDGDPGEAARRGRMLGGLYDLRAQDFTAAFRESIKGKRAEKGKPYPDVYDDRTLGRLSSFLFVRSELPEHLPTPTLHGVTTVLTTGLRGYFTSKQPLYEMLQNPGDKRAGTMRTLLEAAARSARTGVDLERALTVAMYYRLRDVSRELARRILDDDLESYEDDTRRQSTILLAGHALMSFGQSPEDLQLVEPLMRNDGQVRLGGYRKEDNRKYIEIREMGMMAVFRLLGRGPEDIGGTSKVAGYCPIKRLTRFDAIRDPARWPGILDKLETWIDAELDRDP